MHNVRIALTTQIASVLLYSRIHYFELFIRIYGTHKYYILGSFRTETFQYLFTSYKMTNFKLLSISL